MSMSSPGGSPANVVPARVGVLFGGPSPEHDVSVLTGLQAVRGLSGTAGVREIRSIYWAKDGEWFDATGAVEAAAFADGSPRGAVPLRLSAGGIAAGFTSRRGRFPGRDERLELDALLPCCHGGPGEDGTLQGLLDLAGIPYAGPNAAGAFLGMDKLAFSALCSSAFLPTLPRMPLAEGDLPDFDPPFIVKPRYGGSSIGVEVVEDFSTAIARLRVNPHLARGAVLEPYRPELYDLQIAIRSYPKLESSAIERPLRASDGAEILGYADKYVGPEGMTTAPRELPAEIPSELAEQIRRSAREVAALVGLRGVARVDFLSDGEGAYVNEINTIPGSLSRYLFVDPPIPFSQLLADLLAEAVVRPSATFSTAGADGTLLRSAGSIARKLG